jgi:hypothetical protein
MSPFASSGKADYRGSIETSPPSLISICSTQSASSSTSSRGYPSTMRTSVRLCYTLAAKANESQKDRLRHLKANRFEKGRVLNYSQTTSVTSDRGAYGRESCPSQKREIGCLIRCDQSMHYSMQIKQLACLTPLPGFGKVPGVLPFLVGGIRQSASVQKELEDFYMPIIRRSHQGSLSCFAMRQIGIRSLFQKQLYRRIGVFFGGNRSQERRPAPRSRHIDACSVIKQQFHDTVVSSTSGMIERRLVAPETIALRTPLQ